jgi:hypothetical protein
MEATLKARMLWTDIMVCVLQEIYIHSGAAKTIHDKAAKGECEHALASLYCIQTRMIELHDKYLPE